ncbi:(deoxy)nucleoside triphosphate pyrophosphohydrolase [Prosthecobacter debontii]|nr:(deoxy)nucleoside triphosphate pyrophosphohydrolase [Prosthecobacter debontii]
MSVSAAPIDVVCAIIRRGDQILLAQRPPGKSLAGMWEFPGGKIDPGETAEEALHRELMEELGCQVVILAVGPPVVHAYEWGRICLHPFLCELASASPKPTAHEHSELAWVFKKNILCPDLAPADVAVVAWVENLA